MNSHNKDTNPPKASIKDIELGRDLVIKKKTPDSLDKNEILELELQEKRQKIKNLEADRELRQNLAKRVLRYLEIYSLCVLGLILLNGFQILTFNIPELTLLALVGSTAVAAIGLVGFVAKGLFK